MPTEGDGTADASRETPAPEAQGPTEDSPQPRTEAAAPSTEAGAAVTNTRTDGELSSAVAADPAAQIEPAANEASDAGGALDAANHEATPGERDPAQGAPEGTSADGAKNAEADSPAAEEKANEPVAPPTAGQLLARRLGREWQPAAPPERRMLRLLAALVAVPMLASAAGAGLWSELNLHASGNSTAALSAAALAGVALFVLNIARANGRRLQPEWGLAIALAPWIAGRAARVDAGHEGVSVVQESASGLLVLAARVGGLARERMSDSLVEACLVVALTIAALSGIALHRDDDEERGALDDALADRPRGGPRFWRDPVVLAQGALFALLGGLFAAAFCLEPRDALVLAPTALVLGLGLRVRRLAEGCARVPTSEWVGPLRKRVAIALGAAVATATVGRAVFLASIARALPPGDYGASGPLHGVSVCGVLPEWLPVDESLPVALALALVAGLSLAWYPVRGALARCFSRRAAAVVLGVAALALVCVEAASVYENYAESEVLVAPLRSLEAPAGVQLATHRAYSDEYVGLRTPWSVAPAAIVDAQGSLWVRATGDAAAARADSVTLARVFDAPRPRPTRAWVLFDERVSYAAMGRALRPLLLRNVALHTALPAQGLPQRGAWSVYDAPRAQHYRGLRLTFADPRRIRAQIGARYDVGPDPSGDELHTPWGGALAEVPAGPGGTRVGIAPRVSPYAHPFAEVHGWVARANRALGAEAGWEAGTSDRTFVFPHPDAP